MDINFFKFTTFVLFVLVYLVLSGGVALVVSTLAKRRIGENTDVLFVTAFFCGPFICFYYGARYLATDRRI